MENRNILIILGVVIVAALMRLMPHPPNFAPIGALALFCGAYLQGRLRFLLPLSAMFLSDLFLGFHATMPFVYGSFALIILLGDLLRKNQQPLRLIGVSLLSSVLFFVVTNFGVWLTSGMYMKSVFGLTEAYVMGIPFFKNTVFGDLAYSIAFFYGLYLFEKFLAKSPKHLLKSKTR